MTIAEVPTISIDIGDGGYFRTHPDRLGVTSEELLGILEKTLAPARVLQIRNMLQVEADAFIATAPQGSC